MYFSARTEGRISYGDLGRTDSCFIENHRRSDYFFDVPGAAKMTYSDENRIFLEAVFYLKFSMIILEPCLH